MTLYYVQKFTKFSLFKIIEKMKLAFFEKAEYNVHVHASKLFYKVVLRKKIIQPPSPA